MSKMLKTHQNTIGNLVIALLFVGGCIFLLTGSWDTSESEAAKGCCGGDTTVKSCCGGGTTLVAETTGSCCGSTNQLSGSGSSNCDCLDKGNEDANCGACGSSNCGGDTTLQECAGTCAGNNCGPGNDHCNETDFLTVCNEETNKAGCSGDEDGCNKDD